MLAKINAKKSRTLVGQTALAFSNKSWQKSETRLGTAQKEGRHTYENCSATPDA